MNILAIETSCDETSVAIVRDGREVLANIIASQIGLHQRFGGVVPELASRQHIVTLIPTLEEAMRHAGLDWDSIDAVAVTCGPGLAGALLVGLNAAKAIAFARNKPLIAVNHLEAHIYSNWIIPETLERDAPPPREPRPAAEQTRAGAALRALGVEPPRRAGETDLPPGPPAGGRPQYTPPPPKQEAPRPRLDQPAPTDPAFPLLCLVVSGGHTELIYMSGHGQYSLLGKTVDDAAGEAFDKVARVLGLPYPGGPAIQRVAAFGNPDAIDLPRTVLRGSADFSFSGLKTAVLRQAQNYGPPITPEEQAAEREAAERARREEEARLAAEERARHEAEERARREEEARLAAEERARREAEERVRWEAEEQARREAAEERRAAAEARRAEEERALQEEADRRAVEARTRRAAPPPAEDGPRRAAGTSERPAISILGAGRTTPRPAPPEPAPETPPAPAASPAEAEPEPPALPRKSRNSGLIRVTPESIRPEVGPPPSGVERFDREPAPPITVRPERDTPRVLGKTEQEEVPPPAFLAERGGGAPLTPMRRRPAPPSEPDVPAFLRGRPQPAEPPAEPPPGKKPSPPVAPASPTKPASRATPPENEERRPARPAPATPVEPPAQPRATRPATTPGPASPPASRATESRTAPAPPAAAKPAPPAPPERTSTPAAPTPARPAPPRRPLNREVRAIPKSVQAGRAPKEGTEEDDVDQAIDDLLDESAPRPHKQSSWLDADEDEDLGTDDEPPPRPGRGSLGVDGPRPPEARVPVPTPDESDEGEAADAPASNRRTAKPKPEKPRLPVADFAASFQAAAVEILVDKTVAAAAAYKVRTVLLAGGVAANAHLRERLREKLGPDITLRYPPPILCTDNAAMVAAAAYFRYEAGLQHDWTLDIDPNARYVE